MTGSIVLHGVEERREWWAIVRLGTPTPLHFGPQAVVETKSVAIVWSGRALSFEHLLCDRKVVSNVREGYLNRE
jgi:hypothetical protein